MEAGPRPRADRAHVAGTKDPSNSDLNNDPKYKKTYYNVPGWKGFATRYENRESPKAWALALRNDVCDITRLGPRVTFIGRSPPATRPIPPSWYRIEGGPLNGMIVKLIERESSCSLQVGTPEYAELARWRVPPPEWL